jgi:hypothetical protein
MGSKEETSHAIAIDNGNSSEEQAYFLQLFLASLMFKNVNYCYLELDF